MTNFEDFDKFNDVFEIERVKPFPEFLENKRVFTANDLFQSIWSALTKGKVTGLMNAGIECRVMAAGKAGWQKGRLVMKLEFIPDPIPEIQDEKPLQNDLQGT